MAIASLPLEDFRERPRQPPWIMVRRPVTHRQVGHHQPATEHAPGLKVDVVLADRRAAGDYAVELEKAAGLLGGRLVMTDLAMRDGSPRHDPRRLAGAFAEIFEGE